MEKLKDLLPSQKRSLTIFWNEHETNYQTVKEYADDVSGWISEESKQKSIELNTVWELIWYPDTPIGSYRLAAHDFEALIAYYHENKGEFK